MRMFVCGLIATVSCVNFACKKDSTSLPSETYYLYNYSSGIAKDAGLFTIQKQSNGTAALSIQLSQEYRAPGIQLSAFLTTADTSNLVFATLGEVNGASGTGVVNPVKTDGDNQSVPYDSLISKKGYSVRILNMSNVQASGSIR